MQNVWAFWAAVCSIMGNGCNPGGFILQAWEVAVIPWWVSKGVGRRMQRIHANEALWSSSLIRLEQASLSLREAVSWAVGKVPNQSLPALWLWRHSRHPGGRSLKKTLAGGGKVMEFRTRPPEEGGRAQVFDGNPPLDAHLATSHILLLHSANSSCVPTMCQACG